MEVDSKGRMGNVFWSDARSRRAYGFFRDVVVFDTTFNTNCYGMVFAPLLGVNNHRQTVLFGCAFLTSETTDSFVWLLEEFKKVMSDEPPKMIITDQDAAMSKAIAKVCKVASDFIDSALLCDEGFELLEKSFEDIRGKLTSSSSSDTELSGPVGENLQPTQSTQDSEPTMTKSFMQEFDFTWGYGVPVNIFVDIYNEPSEFLKTLVESHIHCLALVVASFVDAQRFVRSILLCHMQILCCVLSSLGTNSLLLFSVTGFVNLPSQISQLLLSSDTLLSPIMDHLFPQRDHRSPPRLRRRLEEAAVVVRTLDNWGHIPMSHRSPPDLLWRLNWRTC
ncbi:hypothetical protein L3X38_017813 [Prunus dulcis]|uniref:MULE transposase domain-containing protein n=1 Tax=Prunus dulcis TaxID=3755 RepID=A0AAD4Z9I1_PRUDU|nr:hypothetical protein L3X38_017813 [Prunus dulcis]